MTKYQQVTRDKVQSRRKYLEVDQPSKIIANHFKAFDEHKDLGQQVNKISPTFFITLIYCVHYQLVSLIQSIANLRILIVKLSFDLKEMR